LINKTKAVFLSVGKKGFFHLLSANLLLQLAGFASQFFVAGFLEPIDLGRIKIMQSIIQIIVILAGVGLNSSVLKLCSENRTQQETEAIYLSGLIVTLLSTFIAYFCLIALSFLNALSTDEVINNLMFIFAIAIIPIAINSYQTAFLQAVKRVKDIAKIQVTTKIIAIVLIIVLTYYFSLIGFLVATIFGFFFTSALFIYKTREAIYSGSRSISNLENFFIFVKEHLYYAKYSSIANVSGQLAIVADMLFINYFIEDRASIGQYAFALTLVLILDLLLSTIQQMCAPYFSGMENNRIALLSSFKKYQGYLYIIVIILPVCVYIALSLIVLYAFDEKYSQALQLFPFLLSAWAIRALYSLKGVVFWGSGYVKLSSILGIINIALSIPLLYIGAHYNVIGVATAKLIAMLISYCTVSTTFYFLYYKKIDHAS
jgi:O-antigen/teichoic acid export membrane protein